ncbi:PREDICTED: neuropeptide Y receptor-like [Priapulus caudatus]|uniref:Neuropeptide Y receptor-like n=1 Tax=Priapulus caudatus TaxID=37621 RepID=A0ABM1E144_PRICU|nr:PREDICTED: neuropeptide Y receptor-like [Priapulus caudatus]
MNESNSTDLNASVTDGPFGGTYFEHPLLKAFICAMYAVIFLVGTSGNFLVCFVVYRKQNMQTVTNIFITNLAISDMCQCILSVPFTPLSGYMRSWVFGRVLCHVVPMVSGVGVFVSTLTLTAIALDRYIVICYPFKPRMRMCTCLLVIFCIWCVSVSFSLPIGLHMVLTPDNQCNEEWPDQAQKIYTICSFALQFVIPLTVISFCYIRVSLKLSRQAKKHVGQRSSKREEQDLKRKARLNRMLIAMVVMFGVCWLPLDMIHLLMFALGEPFTQWRYFLIVFLVWHMLAMSQTCYNPLLYSWLNENFRKEFKDVLPCFSTNDGQRDRRSNSTYIQTTACNGSSPQPNHSLLQPGACCDEEIIKPNKAVYHVNEGKVTLKNADEN